MKQLFGTYCPSWAVIWDKFSPLLHQLRSFSMSNQWKWTTACTMTLQECVCKLFFLNIFSTTKILLILKIFSRNVLLKLKPFVIKISQHIFVANRIYSNIFWNCNTFLWNAKKDYQQEIGRVASDQLKRGMCK